MCMQKAYIIVQNFDLGGLWRFDAFQLDRQNYPVKLFKNNTSFTGVWCKTVTIRQNIFRQLFEELVSINISPVKILRYTVVNLGGESAAFYATVYFLQVKQSFCKHNIR